MSLHISQERIDRVRKYLNENTISNYRGMTLEQLSDIINVPKTAISYVLKLDNLLKRNLQN